MKHRLGVQRAAPGWRRFAKAWARETSGVATLKSDVDYAKRRLKLGWADLGGYAVAAGVPSLLFVKFGSPPR